MNQIKKWEADTTSDLNKIVPPPDGNIVLCESGAVIMSKKTFEEYENTAEADAIQNGRRWGE